MFQIPGYDILAKYGVVNFASSDDYVCRARVETPITDVDMAMLESLGWVRISWVEVICTYDTQKS